ncbi:MAG: SpoIIE family protein phosphatase, partial [Pyrinomonadaceae bacterium]|nr:SpoIIE family protein phosphatase [Pyrinomonadaceae bacterium]
MSRRTFLSAVFFAVVLLYMGLGFYQLFALLPKSTPGWLVRRDGDRLKISAVMPDGPAKDLRASDEIVLLNNREIKSAEEIVQFIQPLEAGTAYTLRIRRNGEIKDYALRTAPLPPGALALIFTARVILPLVFFLIGLAVFILKPHDTLAWMLGLLFGLCAIVFSNFLSIGLPGWVAFLAQAVGIPSVLFFPVFFHFFLIFPEPSPSLRRFPRLPLYAYLAFLVLIIPYDAIVTALHSFAPQRAQALRSITYAHGIIFSLLALLTIVGGLLALILNYRQAGNIARRKMRIVVVGGFVGLLPLVLFTILFSVFGTDRISTSTLLWLNFIIVGLFLLFPLSFAYAIARHQVIPVSLIIRRGIRYLFVARGSVALEVMTVSVVMFFLMDALFRNNPMSGRSVGVISGVVAIIVWTLTRAIHTRVISPVIDRRFFRRAYNAQQILAELGEALRTMTDPPEMARLVSAKIQDSLQTESIAVFLYDEKTKEYACATAAQYVEASHATVSACEGLSLPVDAFIIQRLRESGQPLAVNFDDANSSARALVSADAGENESRARENEIMQRIRAQLILPIATKEQLFGFVALGPRLGDLPFSGEDRSVLQSVVWQMALALENAQLISRKAEEERLRHELEIASEVQQRLFPQRLPATEGLELAGVCIPARGVGGDYYDFIKIGDSQIGIAVADVAGKGISAALLMSIVQASLRSHVQTARGCLTDLVTSMNALLFESTAANSYATFFYAQFDEKDRAFTYVNAGHNPPMLVRANVAQEAVSVATAEGVTTQVVRREAQMSAVAKNPASLLTTGGPVSGIFESCSYEQETIQVQTGDVLVAYT